MVEVNSSIHYDSIPVRRDIFDTLYELAMGKNNTQFNNLGFKLIRKPNEEDYFTGSASDCDVKSKNFLHLVNSNKKIPSNFTSYSSDTHRVDKKNTTYKQKLKKLPSVSGIVFNIPNEMVENASDFITYGPYFTLPHRDELLMGGITLMPSWNTQKVIKIWMFSTSTERRHDSLMQFRATQSSHTQEHRNAVGKEMIDLINRGLVLAVAQFVGQVLIFPSGHSHAVITAFSSSTTTAATNDTVSSIIHQQQVCFMHTKFIASNISFAKRMLEFSHINSGSSQDFAFFRDTFNRVFTPNERNAHDKKMSISTNKRKQTKNSKKDLIAGRLARMMEGRKKQKSFVCEIVTSSD